MSQVLIREKPPQSSRLQHPFLQEFIQQIRLADTLNQYCNWTDESLLDRLIGSSNRGTISSKNLIFDPLNQLLIHAFYHAIGATIQRRTGHPTDTFVHLKSKEFNSAVISCGGVLVLYSLIWGYKSLKFLSVQQLIESAEINISNAITKANQYLDFV